MTQATAPKNRFLDAFEDLEKLLSGHGPEWLRAARVEARARFEKLGFPSPRLEAWKNTNVDAIASTGFGPAPLADPGDTLPERATLDIDGPRFVFVDGRFSPERSTSPEDCPSGLTAFLLGRLADENPEGLRELLLSRDVEEQTPFFSLNQALNEDGIVLRVADGADIASPVQLIFFTPDHGTPTASHPRVVVYAGKGSRVSVIETYAGAEEASYLTNSVTDVVVGPDASVSHCRVQRESATAYHVSSSRFELGRDARLRTFNVDLGTRLTRNDLRAVMNGEGAHSQMFGLYALRDSQHVDNHTIIEHALPHGDSREVYKGVLGGKSRSVFNGRIIVREDAQKTDAKQSNPNILLSDEAQAHTRPQLEIYADDVKCTHGATVGRLDAESIFYLRSRGISETDARAMMITAYAGEVLELIENETLRERLDADLAERLRELEDGCP